MVGKSQIKLVKSLQQKKYRKQEGLFIAEGVKVISELLDSDFEPYRVYATDASLLTVDPTLFTLVDDSTLQRLSLLKSPNKALALFRLPTKTSHSPKGLTVALDAIQDPGNLGTIIRLCDWFGIGQLVCSKETVDCFNPKVVQATMGSLARVQVHYVDLEAFLKETDVPVFGGFMDGDSVYEMDLPENAVLVMGNEGNGISDAIAQLIQHKVSIPRFGKLKATESLNVATATAILLSEFRRNY